METASTLLLKLQELEQVYTTLETKMNNLALLFCQSQKADENTVLLIDEDTLDDYFKIGETLEAGLKDIIKFTEDAGTIPEVERAMLFTKGKDVLDNFKGGVQRRESLLAVMCATGVPSELWELNKSINDKLINEKQRIFDGEGKQLRVGLKRDGSLCFACYQTFEHVQTEVIIPLVSIVVFQSVSTTGNLIGTPAVTITINADNAPNRLQGVGVKDPDVACLVIKQLLEDAGIPLFKESNTKLAININMLERKWEQVSLYANVLRFRLNMLLWPQYFVNTDSKFQPTEKLEADVLNDVKKATGFDDASIKYRMEIMYPMCTVFVTLTSPVS